MKKQKGFSLIELLIVVAIILIIAAIAIPNLLRARMSANEASAVGSLRTINTAQIQYNTTYGVGFASTLTELGGTAPCTAAVADACLIDDVLTSGNKSGYTFTLAAAGTGNTTYTVTAAPITPNQTGIRYFFTDESGVIRVNPTGAATSSSSALQ